MVPVARSGERSVSVVMDPISRRNFLKVSTFAGLGAAAGIAVPAASGLVSIDRTPHGAYPHRLKIAIADYMFNSRFKLDGTLGKKGGGPAGGGGGQAKQGGGQKGARKGEDTAKAKQSAAPVVQDWDLFSFLDFCSEWGVDGAQISSYFFSSRADDYFFKLKRHAFLKGLTLSGIGSASNPSMPYGPARDEDMAEAKKVIDYAAILGVTFVRFYPGQVFGGDRAEGDKRMIASFEELGDYAGKRGVIIGVENHDETPVDRMVPIIKQVNSPWVGISLAIANTVTDAQLWSCMPYLVNYRLWFEDAGPDGNVSPANFKRISDIFRKGNYRGWIVLQREGGDPWETALPRNLKLVREYFGAV